MKQSAHTKGPWTSLRNSAAGRDVIASEVMPLDICVVSKFGKSAEEVNANSLVLAAAAEMLEALIATEDADTPIKQLEAMDMRRAAIAKATGKA